MGTHRMLPDRKVNWHHCVNIPVVYKSQSSVSRWCNKAGGRYNECAPWSVLFSTTCTL